MENQTVEETRFYRPILLPRRGELIAWFCAALCAAAWLVLHLSRSPVFIGLRILAVLLILVAVAISMSNWMDRKTVLKTNAKGIAFDNGLRKASLDWQSIREVEVISSNLGNKVRVLGDAAHFDFRTLGEVALGGEVKGQMGFRDGEKILKEIVLRAGLKEKQAAGASCVYYARL